jgi:plasmid stabilization system protein ParE
MSIRYHHSAVRDLNEALAYYDQRNAYAAQRFVDAVRAGEQTILDFPEIACSLGGKLRVLRVTRFPYSLVYLPIDSDVLIVAVAHHKRRPTYWKNRLRDVN